MSARNSLYAFMPYGAPELLDASRAHMARSVAVSALGWALLFTALLLALPHLPKPAVVVDVTHIIEPLPPPPLIPEAKQAMPQVHPHQAEGPEAATFEPVRDDPGVVPLDPSAAPPDATRQPGGDSGGVKPFATGIGPAGDPDTLPSHLQVQVVDELPREVNLPIPIYPSIARDANVDGMVVVRVLVDPTGHVRDAVVMKGVPMLSEAAREAALRAVFTPALLDGRPVFCWVTVPYRFRLH